MYILRFVVFYCIVSYRVMPVSACPCQCNTGFLRIRLPI